VARRSAFPAQRRLLNPMLIAASQCIKPQAVQLPAPCQRLGSATLNCWPYAHVNWFWMLPESAAKGLWARNNRPALRMIHIDTNQVALIKRIGHCITGDRRKGWSWGPGDAKAPFAVDDARLLAYVKVLPDKQKSTRLGFLVRAVHLFISQCITYFDVMNDKKALTVQSNGCKDECNVALRANLTTGNRLQAIRKAKQTLLVEWI
jgi:hypothetical protein